MSNGNGPVTPEGWVRTLGRGRKDLSSTELHLLLELAALHNRHHQVAHARTALLSAETHLSERQIMRVLTHLADPERQGGPVLHISYGPLPVESKSGHPIYGNVYRFIGFDPIPDNARPRRMLGGRPARSVDTDVPADDSADDTADDTMATDQMTSGVPADDTGDTNQMTSANSPLYPVEYPAAGFQPAVSVYPVRARGPDEAAPRAAADEPKALRRDAQECPICRQAFTGPYAEHTATAHKVRARAEPGNLGGALAARPPTRGELDAELARLARERAELSAQMPPELRADLLAEHEVRIARERDLAAKAQA